MKRVGICAITLLLCFCSLLLVGCGDKEFNPGGNTPGGGSSQKSEISFEYNDIGMQVGDERTIKVVISEDVTDKNYSITSYNSSIVTASKTTTGVKLIAKSTGTATITLSSIYGTDTLTVKVNSKTISLTASNVSSYLRVTTTKLTPSFEAVVTKVLLAILV